MIVCWYILSRETDVDRVSESIFMLTEMKLKRWESRCQLKWKCRLSLVDIDLFTHYLSVLTHFVATPCSRTIKRYLSWHCHNCHDVTLSCVLWHEDTLSDNVPDTGPRGRPWAYLVQPSVPSHLRRSQKKRCHRDIRTHKNNLRGVRYLWLTSVWVEEFFPRLYIFLTPFHLSLTGYKSDGNLYTFI